LTDDSLQSADKDHQESRCVVGKLQAVTARAMPL